ncbi:MAG: hypothetical protein AB7D07_02080 [Desulfovibrionaceae bacterium]
MVSLEFVTEADGVVPGFPLLCLRTGDARPGPVLQCDGRRPGGEAFTLTWNAAHGADPKRWVQGLADCLSGLGWEHWRLSRDSWTLFGGLDAQALDAFADAFWPVYRPVGRMRVLLDIPDEPGLRDAARAWTGRHKHLRFDLKLAELLQPPETEKDGSLLARLRRAVTSNVRALPQRIHHGHRQIRTGED